MFQWQGLAPLAAACRPPRVARADALFPCGLLRYPLEDLAYATKRAQGPFPGYRQMIAAFE